jgi:hypothetical protein
MATPLSMAPSQMLAQAAVALSPVASAAAAATAGLAASAPSVTAEQQPAPSQPAVDGVGPVHATTVPPSSGPGNSNSSDIAQGDPDFAAALQRFAKLANASAILESLQKSLGDRFTHSRDDFRAAVAELQTQQDAALLQSLRTKCATERAALTAETIGNRLLKAGMSAWFLNSRKKTKGMEIGHLSERRLCLTLHQRIASATQNVVAIMDIYTLGLVVRRDFPAVGATVDAIARGSIREGSVDFIAVEMKCKTTDCTAEAFLKEKATKGISSFEEYDLREDAVTGVSGNDASDAVAAPAWSRFVNHIPRNWRVQIIQHLAALDLRHVLLVVADRESAILFTALVTVSEGFVQSYCTAMQGVFARHLPWTSDEENCPHIPPQKVEKTGDCPDAETLLYSLRMRRGLIAFLKTNAASLACIPPVKDILSDVAHRWNHIKASVDTQTKKDERVKPVIPHVGILAHTAAYKVLSHILSHIHTSTLLLVNARRIRAAASFDEILELIRGDAYSIPSHAVKYLLDSFSTAEPALPIPHAKEGDCPPTNPGGKKKLAKESRRRLEGGPMAHRPSLIDIVSWKYGLAKKNKSGSRPFCWVCGRETSDICLQCNTALCSPTRTHPDCTAECYYLYHTVEALPSSSDSDAQKSCLRNLPKSWKPRWTFRGANAQSGRSDDGYGSDHDGNDDEKGDDDCGDDDGHNGHNGHDGHDDDSDGGDGGDDEDDDPTGGHENGNDAAHPQDARTSGGHGSAKNGARSAPSDGPNAKKRESSARGRRSAGGARAKLNLEP